MAKITREQVVQMASAHQEAGCLTEARDRLHTYWRWGGAGEHTP